MSSHGADLDGFRPGGAVRGRVVVPPSKSIVQRALVCGALAEGTTVLEGFEGLGGGPAGDVASLVSALRGLGARIERGADGVARLRGRPPAPSGDGAGEPAAVDVGESGTAARLLTAAVALGCFGARPVDLAVRGSLRGRASPALLAALRAAGARIEGAVGARASWPARLHPLRSPPPALALERPGSSQEVSAILVALAAWPGEGRLTVLGRVPSAPYVALTAAVLSRFGAEVRDAAGAEGTGYSVVGPLRAPAAPLRVEPDASAAAVALAAGCLSGGEVEVAGLGRDSLQGDVRIVEHLRAFGCEAGERAGALFARGEPSRGAELDLSGEPDLAPVLAAVAGVAALRGRGPSRLSGLGTLPGKESSRIEVLARGLAALGLAVDAGDDALAVASGAPRAGGGASGPEVDAVELDSAGDHRMAFAFGLLGLARDAVDVRGAGAVRKSWPRFWDELAEAGAERRTLPPA